MPASTAARRPADPTGASAPRVLVASWADVLPAAASTVRSVRDVLPDAPLDVLDVDGSWVPVGGERVVSPADAGTDDGTLHRRAAAVGTAAVARALLVDLLPPDGLALVVAPGVVLLRPPTELLDAAAAAGVAVVARAGAAGPATTGWPGPADLVRAGVLHPALLAVRHAPAGFLAAWRTSWRTPDLPWLDAAAAGAGAHVLAGPAALLGPWNLTPTTEVADGPDGLRADGRDVVALDLTRFDHARPWLLDPDADATPRARLSDHPALAARCAHQAAARAAHPPAAPRWDAAALAGGGRVDDVVRGLLRDAVLAGQDVPDPLTDADATLAWLTAPPVPGAPGRYLRALYAARTDLHDVFPGVPGEHTAGFLHWARTHGRTEERYEARVVDAAVAAVGTPPPAPDGGARPRGVNVVGYLGGDIGIGESARLVLEALGAGGVPTRAVPVEKHLQSRRRPYPLDPGPALGTTVVCVNADMVPSVARTVPGLLARGPRVGMWYWEVEEFPAEQAAAADLLDEVWVATDFVRDAVAPHVRVPVRVVPPPLPQARPTSVGRAELGLPTDRPVVLFVFDYLSTVERKNPLGVLEAFRRAFAPDEGPVLVLKSINGDRRPSPAERLRLRAAAEPDVVLLEDYLDAAERDALVASCDMYVSLHRAEGLGLTMAEAMAYGKPVVATRYGGNLQFMTDENSFLVPFARVSVGPGAEPYPPTSPWAEPDLDAAAAMLRVLVDDPAEAARRGARAAQDIATRWSPAAVSPAWVEAVGAVRRRPGTTASRPRAWAAAARRRLTGSR